MRRISSGFCLRIDATHGHEHRLEAGLTISGPFTSRSLVLRFPRWVPGSYFLREPIQHMFDFEARDQEGQPLKWKRVGVDGITVRLKRETSEVAVDYSLFAKELTVRSNHLDATHLHMMPPFTWFWPEKGVETERLAHDHVVELTAPQA